MFSKWFISSVLAVFLFLVLISSTSFLQLKARVFAPRSQNEELVALKSEVAALEAKLALFSGIMKRVPVRETRYALAMTYSTYPFNAKQTLTINVGSEQGISERMAVVSVGKMFVGRVAQVFNDAAIVQTVFDPGFEMPVRIGEEGVSAILRGGSAPYLDLISKTAHIAPGEGVLTSGTVAPFGVPLGTVGKVHTMDYEAFQSAAVELPYALGDLREVLVITNYVPVR